MIGEISTDLLIVLHTSETSLMVNLGMWLVSTYKQNNGSLFTQVVTLYPSADQQFVNEKFARQKYDSNFWVYPGGC